MPFLSIIIVNYRNPEVAKNCLHSLNECFFDFRFEIILIDTGAVSDDMTVYNQIIPEIIYIRVIENVGFSRANNIGLQIAKGDYVLLLNSDTLFPDPLAISESLQFLISQEKIGSGLLGCKLLSAEGHFEPSYFPFKFDNILLFDVLDNQFLYRLLNLKKRYQEPFHVMQVLDVSGAFMLLKMEVIEKIGPLDPDFFLYYEESEWCRNRISKNYKILFYPNAKIIHLGGASTPIGQTFLQSRLSLSLFWYKKGLLNYLLYILVVYLNVLAYIPISIFFPRGHFTRNYIDAYLKLLPYIFMHIPSSSKGYGKRTSPLIYVTR
jgi:GT2 family glycosyltransferase